MKHVKLIRPDGSEELIELDGHPTQEQMEAWVGGWWERTRVPNGNPDFAAQYQDMLVNEEGAIMRPPLPVNAKATQLAQRRDDWQLRGTVALLWDFHLE